MEDGNHQRAGVMITQEVRYPDVLIHEEEVRRRASGEEMETELVIDGVRR